MRSSLRVISIKQKAPIIFIKGILSTVHITADSRQQTSMVYPYQSDYTLGGKKTEMTNNRLMDTTIASLKN